jgi:hypothetical protein
MPEARLYRGLVARFTRLDVCGRPVYGECGQIVTRGFVSVSQSAQFTEGEGISQPAADGGTCLNIPATNTFSHYELEIVLCAVNPVLAQIIDPSVELVHDGEEIIGYDTGDSSGLSTDEVGFAMELWMAVSSEDDVCTGSVAQGRWGYLLYPRVVGASEGDLEVANAALTTTFTGTTRAPNGWRRGPYQVWADANGVPGPLPQPMPPTKHRRFIPVTTLRPPEPETECLPVDRPVPDPADLYVTGVVNETPRRTVRLRADNHGLGPVLVTWADGSEPQQVADGTWVTHTYDGDGEYPITVADAQTPVVTATRTVTIPLPADEPTLTLSGDNPDNPFEITATIGLPSHANPAATVDWGDGAAAEEVTVSAAGTVSVLHTYQFPNIYYVAARRGDLPTYRTREAVRVPIAQAPAAEVEADPDDPTGMTAVVTYDNTGNGLVAIDWGDGTPVQQVPESGTAEHAYTALGEYTIRVASAAEPTAAVELPITVPLGQEEPGPRVTAVADPSDLTGMTVQLDIDNTDAGQPTGPQATAGADTSDLSGMTVQLDIDTTA